MIELRPRRSHAAPPSTSRAIYEAPPAEELRKLLDAFAQRTAQRSNS